ncbi:MAG TPA: serine hydrolase domain-containing protein [Longimicrobium sp.]|nr:serine hydrolase domain-containing protein [Longimicrobium sp.]
MLQLGRRGVRLGCAAVLAAGCGAADREPDAAARTPATQLAAQTRAPAPDPLTGPDSARTRARIDSVFARFDRPGWPGCVVTVMRAGDIAFSRGYGYGDIAARTPLTPSSAFDGASMAKQFLAFSVALLAAEGRLSLDDPVHRHLPELPDYGAPITLRHLIHHTGGLRDWDAVWLSGRRDLHPSTLRGLSFPPGTRHAYDDTGYGMLEEVVERITGKPWGEFARERIWTPLGMMSTGTPAPGTPLPRLVQGYAQRDGGGFRPIGVREGFTVTAPDLARWDRNFYDARVGGPRVIRMMTEEGRLASGETIPYAMALHTEPYRGLRRQWHGGLAGGYRSQFMRYPDQRTSVLVQCNVYQLAEPNSLAEAVTDIVLADAIAQAEDTPPSAAVLPPPAAELERLAGLYVNREIPALRPVRFHEGRLQVRQWITWHETKPLGQDRFRVAGQPLTIAFRRGADGGAGLLEEHWDGRRTPEVLHAAPAVRLTTAELDAYTGRYASGELGTSWTLAREGSGLRVIPRHGPRRVALLRPAGRDAFSDHEYVLLIFDRDSAGRVTGFSLSTPRVQNLRFARDRG